MPVRLLAGVHRRPPCRGAFHCRRVPCGGARHCPPCGGASSCRCASFARVHRRPPCGGAFHLPAHPLRGAPYRSLPSVILLILTGPPWWPLSRVGHLPLVAYSSRSLAVGSRCACAYFAIGSCAQFDPKAAPTVRCAVTRPRSAPPAGAAIHLLQLDFAVNLRSNRGKNSPPGTSLGVDDTRRSDPSAVVDLPDRILAVTRF